MKRSAIFSGILHVVVILLIYFGMPRWKNNVELLQPVPVEFRPIDDETMAPDANNKIDPEPEKIAEEKPKETQPEPMPTPEPVAEPVVEPTPEPDPIPEPTPEPEPIPEPVPEPAPKPEPKPEPKKQEKPKPKPKKKEEKKKEEVTDSKDFMSVLKNLKKQKQKQETAQSDSKEESSSRSGKIGDKLSMSEMDALRKQISQCWSPPAGAENGKDLSVEIKIYVNPDRTVKDAKIVNAGRANSDPYYKIAAESALRAVRDPRCSPLKLPEDKYEMWKEFTFNFDPKKIL